MPDTAFSAILEQDPAERTPKKEGPMAYYCLAVALGVFAGLLFSICNLVIGWFFAVIHFGNPNLIIGLVAALLVLLFIRATSDSGLRFHERLSAGIIAFALSLTLSKTVLWTRGILPLIPR